MRIFGSAVEGKAKPNDVDILVAVRNGSIPFGRLSPDGPVEPIVIQKNKIHYFVMPESEADDLLEALLWTGRKAKGHEGHVIEIPRSLFSRETPRRDARECGLDSRDQPQ